MQTCDRCAQFGLRFHRQYEPAQFIEGDPDARVWIIGLNPAESQDWVDPRPHSELRDYFSRPDVHSYFKQFRLVSERLYSMLGEKGGAAHTDLVKCSSYSWPPESAPGSARAEIIKNCSVHLQRQLDAHHPRVLVCNGSEVSQEVRRLLPPPVGTRSTATSYVHTRQNGTTVTVVLSGFIGRIDNYAKRRLGAEVESHLDRDEA